MAERGTPQDLLERGIGRLPFEGANYLVLPAGILVAYSVPELGRQALSLVPNLDNVVALSESGSSIEEDEEIAS